MAKKFMMTATEVMDELGVSRLSLKSIRELAGAAGSHFLFCPLVKSCHRAANSAPIEIDFL